MSAGAAGLLGLDDEAFFTNPRVREDAQLAELLQRGFRGLLLDGPGAVAVEQRATLPLAGWFALTDRELALGTLDERGVLVGSCVDTGVVLAALALKPDKTPARQRAPEKPRKGGRPDPDKSVSLSLFDLDARARLPGLSWTPGTWCFRLLLRGQTSGVVRVKLEGPAPPATAAAPLPAPRPPWPPAGDGARHGDVEDAPAPPSRRGIALAVEPALVPAEPEARWLLRAGWRLPVRPAERVQTELDGYPGAAAVVPISLVITASGAGGPWVVPLRVPCFALAGDEGTGQLEVDLLRVKGAPRAPGSTYFVHAVAGDVFAEPVSTALVAEQALPFSRGGAP